MFEQIITFPSVQSTLLKCRKEYFPRFPQTAAEFFAAFEQESVFLRYGHCFDDLFFHGVVGNEADGRCGIFYTQRLLAYFDSIKDEIKAFTDATFKYQPLYFHQLFIVHFEIGNYVRFFSDIYTDEMLQFTASYRHFRPFMSLWSEKQRLHINAYLR